MFLKLFKGIFYKFNPYKMFPKVVLGIFQRMVSYDQI